MATDDDEWKAEIERRVSALEDDDAKVHGVIAVAYEWATKWLQRWPWLSTITPLVIGVAGTYFAGPTREVQVPGPKETVTTTTHKETLVPISIAEPVGRVKQLTPDVTSKPRE